MNLPMFLYGLSLAVTLALAIVFCLSPYSYDTVGKDYAVRSIRHTLPADLAFSHKSPPLMVQACVLEELTSMYSLVAQLFSDNSILFWAIGDTLLGAVLVKGVLPWRDRLELAVAFDPAQQRKLIELRPEFLDHGYILVKTDHSYRLCKNNWSKFPYIELTLMSQRSQEMAVCSPLTELNECTYADSHTRRREIFELTSIFPLEQRQFEDMEIPVPREAEQCLKLLYGPEALTLVPTDSYGDKVHFVNSLTAQVVGRYVC